MRVNGRYAYREYSRRCKERHLQQVVRAVPFAIGDVVRLRNGEGDTPPDLQGKQRTISSLAYVISKSGKGWRVFFEEDGRGVPVECIETVLQEANPWGATENRSEVG